MHLSVKIYLGSISGMACSADKIIIFPFWASNAWAMRFIDQRTRVFLNNKRQKNASQKEIAFSLISLSFLLLFRIKLGNECERRNTQTTLFFLDANESTIKLIMTCHFHVIVIVVVVDIFLNFNSFIIRNWVLFFMSIIFVFLYCINFASIDVTKNDMEVQTKLFTELPKVYFVFFFGRHFN